MHTPPGILDYREFFIRTYTRTLYIVNFDRHLKLRRGRVGFSIVTPRGV